MTALRYSPPMLPAFPSSPEPSVPSWAADAIWYQIFPERFLNGCPASNPTPADIGGRPPKNWTITPWPQEWYALDPWAQSFFPDIFHRRYGGDLPGIRQKLPYLRDLGVNALYLNPIFSAPSLHKYDARCHHHVDPTLGPDRAGDLAALAAAREDPVDPDTWIWTAADLELLSLVSDAHAAGMRVILDGVFNHCGREFFAFRDVLANGPASSFASWFEITDWQPFSYRAWDGPNGTLPQFARTPDGATLVSPVRDYLFAATRRWMRPDPPPGAPRDGIDGWRLDVAYCVPHGFWREWHALVRSLNPDAYTTAEIVGPATDWVRPDEFSAVMDYEWLFPTLGFFTPHPDALSAAEFSRRIDALHARHTPAANAAMQNLLDSHDTGRVLTLFEAPAPPFAEFGPYFDFARIRHNPALPTHRPGPTARRALFLAAFWQFTSPGAPMIYYGDELGLWGANDPCCRQPMPWPGLPLDPETLGPGGPLPSPNSRAPNLSLHAHYKSLCALRAAHPALRRGAFAFLPSPHPRL
ncbi:MAG: glycoside hydrolase family 13 protein, partial [Kiritimatiellae bacterium]|nr:glycoside hydrolase family 13 protein [Kiritimatiellia bacterium]